MLVSDPPVTVNCVVDALPVGLVTALVVENEQCGAAGNVALPCQLITQVVSAPEPVRIPPEWFVEFARNAAPVPQELMFGFPAAEK